MLIWALLQTLPRPVGRATAEHIVEEANIKALPLSMLADHRVVDGGMRGDAR